MRFLRIVIDGLPLIKSYTTKREFYRLSERELVDSEIQRIKSKRPTFQIKTETIEFPDFTSTSEARRYHRLNHRNTTFEKCPEYICKRVKRAIERKHTDARVPENDSKE